MRRTLARGVAWTGAAVAALFFGVALPVLAQTTAGSAATIVVPVTAQTGTFVSEVTVYNSNGGAVTVAVQ